MNNQPTGGKLPIRCDLIEHSGTSELSFTTNKNSERTLVVCIRRLNEEGRA
jgi:hypothetical protein